MKDSDKLELLKKLLLEDEREVAESITKKVTEIDKTINVEYNLAEKVDPIITERLQQFINEIPHSLGPTITEALEEQIKNSKDQVVEALYPIMGKMIKKYIQNEFEKLKESINKQVNNTFSTKKWKRKLKAVFTGVKESDLIISDLQKPEIEQFFIIEKDSGLLAGSYAKDSENTIDQDMVSGMLTAIKSFVEDAFKKGNQDLELVEYDLYKIHIINFPLFYFATVISGVFDSDYKNLLEDKLYDLKIDILNDKESITQEQLNKKLIQIFNNDFI